MKNKLLVIVLILLLVVSLFLFVNYRNPQENIIELTINNHTFILEQAITPQEKQKGLMFRTSLEENRGMIFIFENEQERSFWMKNTLIPLDMIFIDENNKITSIQTTQPCHQDPCQTYQAQAKYIIELNAGMTEKIGLKVEDEIELNL